MAALLALGAGAALAAPGLANLGAALSQAMECLAQDPMDATCLQPIAIGLQGSGRDPDPQRTPRVPMDDAQLVAHTIPSQIVAGRSYSVSVTMLNTGRSTWSRQGNGPPNGSQGYKLGARGDEDLFYTTDTRVWLPAGAEVGPEEEYTFRFTMIAPDLPNTYLTDWQMVHEGVRWFGEVLSVQVRVIEPTPTATRTPTPTPTPTTPGRPDPQPTFPIRAAFYYPWFPETWRGSPDPFTRYHPSLGLYDSSNRETIRQHIQAMEYGNIRVGVASWWGSGSPTDRRLPIILDVNRGGGFRWAVYYEAEGPENPHAPGRDPTVEKIRSDLFYLRDHYGSDPSYLRIDGRFVVFVYADEDAHADGCDMVDRWLTANATVNAYLVLKVFDRYGECPRQPDGWHQYAPALAADSQGRFSYTVSPGFWLANAPERLPRDLARWNANIRALIASGANFQLITTFNEWGEGTAVESAAEWESASGFGLYLDVLHNNGQGGLPLRTTPTPTPTSGGAPTQTPTTTPSGVPTPTGTGTPTPTGTLTPTPWPAPITWEDDNFDALAPGSLHGQNGWAAPADRDSAAVVSNPAGGKMLQLDAGAGATIVMGKDVPDQSGGDHVLEVRVMVTSATEASLAKIEVGTSANSGWDKKFQLYFGTSMRVNYSPSGAAASIVPVTEMGRWYQIRCVMDLDSGLMEVWVDGALAASGIPLHPGPILDLGISGWDRPGAVYLDDLRGMRLRVDPAGGRVPSRICDHLVTYSFRFAGTARLFPRCLEADEAIKTGRLEPTLALERSVSELAEVNR